jgi:hypothetical protein
MALLGTVDPVFADEEAAVLLYPVVAFKEAVVLLLTLDPAVADRATALGAGIFRSHSVSARQATKA